MRVTPDTDDVQRMIRVSFCCNDERGNHTAYVSAIDFGDGDLSIAGPDKTMRRSVLAGTASELRGRDAVVQGEPAGEIRPGSAVFVRTRIRPDGDRIVC